MPSDIALREKLRALKGVPNAAPPIGSPPVPAGTSGPTLSDQVQRRRVSRPHEPQNIDQLAQTLDAVAVAPGVLLREQVLPLTHRHGAVALGDALTADMDRIADEAGLAPHELLFIDTETTGLAGGTGTLPFLVGVAQFTVSGIRVRQYLLTGFSGEAAMLEQLSTLLPAAAPLVSFNGKSFDVPLLSTRLRLSRMADVMIARPHVDLVHITRRAYGSAWPDCRLVTAEQRLLDFVREGDISGAEMPQVWFDFVRFNHTKKLQAVLQHNFWDVLTMVALLPRLAAALTAPAEVGADVWRVAKHTLRHRGDAAAQQQLQQGRDHLTWQGALELARLHRRRGEHEDAAKIWSHWAERGCVEAIEHLAKHLEHVQGDYAAALMWTQRLLAAQPGNASHVTRQTRLQRRLAVR